MTLNYDKMKYVNCTVEGTQDNNTTVFHYQEWHDAFNQYEQERQKWSEDLNRFLAEMEKEEQADEFDKWAKNSKSKKT